MQHAERLAVVVPAHGRPLEESPVRLCLQHRLQRVGEGIERIAVLEGATRDIDARRPCQRRGRGGEAERVALAVRAVEAELARGSDRRPEIEVDIVCQAHPKARRREADLERQRIADLGNALQRQPLVTREADDQPPAW